MTNKRREQKRQRYTEAERPIRWAAVLRAIVLAGAVALLVVGALMPSESTISNGTYAPLAAGWCLLLVVWALAMWMDPAATVRLGWTEVFGAALIGWHSLAAMNSLGQTNGRHALNAHWLILGYGLTAFLIRQSLRTAEQARSLLVAMIWLATLLSTLGIYQYAYSMPRQRREYEKDPEKVLRDNGISTEADSPQRELFENRLGSKEPLATFALTNSLAGFLGPWLVATIGLALGCLRQRTSWRAIVAFVAAAGVLAFCLALTKSRTAYLAVLAGFVLFAIYGWSAGAASWRPDWRIPFGLAAAATVIGLAAIFFGGLDVQVLSEAPKSVLYRVEYWQATARVIGDYPLFGCGPGNFQEAYAAHKLPQASEMVADPHNFLLEMWATAGTPAVILLVGLLLAFAVDVSAVVRAGAPQQQKADEDPVAPARWIVSGGAIAGLLIGPTVAAAMGYSLESASQRTSWLPVVWVIGFPLAALAWWMLDRWLTQGDVSLAVVIIPQVVLLINLLAAGAVVFPGVISTLLVLAPVALFVASGSGSAVNSGTPLHLPMQIGLSWTSGGIATLAAALVAMACLYTEYYPVLNGRLALADALYRLDQRQYREAEPKTVEAVKADSLSPEPLRLLAELKLARWQATGRPKDWEDFVQIADAFVKLDPRHHLAWYTRGTWYLTAWRKSENQEDLETAISAFRQAMKRYPNRALYHAQLGWALHLAGQAAEASQEAERALALDQKMPHREQKLNRQHVADPVVSKERSTTFREENAEQTAQRLRNGVAEEKR
jgi:hypothetical protein